LQQSSKILKRRDRHFSAVAIAFFKPRCMVKHTHSNAIMALLQLH